jgi:hypothetical protein
MVGYPQEFCRERTDSDGVDLVTEGLGALDDSTGNQSLSWIRHRASAAMVSMVCEHISNPSRSSHSSTVHAEPFDRM